MRHVIVSALLALGCSSNGSGSSTTGNGATCKGAISGAEAATLSCTSVTWVHDPSTDDAIVSIMGETDTLKSGVMFSCPTYELTGQPQMGSFDFTRLKGFACTVQDGADLWAAGEGMNSSALGSALLRIDSYTPDDTNIWKLHGHLDADAPATPGTGATGDVNLNVDF